MTHRIPIFVFISLITFLAFPSYSFAAWVFPDKTEEVATDKTSLSDRWNEVLADAKSLVTSTIAATSKLPKVEMTTIGNGKLTLDMASYSDELKSISYLVVLIGLLASIFIIFS